MITQTEKMIFPEETVAASIAASLTQTTSKHVVMRVTSGWQVVPVKVIPSAQELYAAAQSKEAAVKMELDAKGSLLSVDAVKNAVSAVVGKVAAEKAAIAANQVTIKVGFSGESKTYYNCYVPGHPEKPLFFGKTTVTEAVVTHDTATLTLSRQVVKKRKLEHLVVSNV